MHIFIDASVRNKVSYGAILTILNLDDVEYQLDIIKLNATSSTEAELELALHVLTHLETSVSLYTDCNNLFRINRSYSPSHRYAFIYDRIRSLIELYNVEIIKMKGHQKKALQISPESKFFSIVDRASRKASRKTS